MLYSPGGVHVLLAEPAKIAREIGRGLLPKPHFEVRRSIRDRYDDHFIRILLDRHSQKSSRSCERRRGVWVGAGDCAPWAIAQRRRTVRSASSRGHGSECRLSRGPRAACSANVRPKQQSKARSSSFRRSGFMRCLALPESASHPCKIGHSSCVKPIPKCVYVNHYTPRETTLFTK